MLIAGHVLQGLCTSLLLIAAPGFLAQTGWMLDSRMTGPELAERYLTDTGLPAASLMRDSLLFVTASKR